MPSWLTDRFCSLLLSDTLALNLEFDRVGIFGTLS